MEKIKTTWTFLRGLKRETVGAILIGAIFVGIGFHIWYTEASKPVEYISVAHAEEIPVKKKDIGIIVRITWTEERIEKEIREVFPEVADLMVKVAWCESRLNKDAKGPTDDHGLFQLHAPSHDLSNIDVYDPAENIRFARKLYDESGLRPWKASKECWMK